MAKLSQRQIEALELVCDGQQYKHIAAELKIAQRTVKTHLQRARQKTGCTSTIELAVKFALERAQSEQA